MHARLGWACVALVGAALGCSTAVVSTGTTASGQRALVGVVDRSAYALDNPVIAAERSTGGWIRTGLNRRGGFELRLAAGPSYRLVLANTLPDGSLQAVSRIRWPGQLEWARFPAAGGALSLGVIRPLEASGAPSSELTLELAQRLAEAESSGSKDGGTCSGRAELPYDARLAVGDSFALVDAFLEKGPPPAQVTKVTLEGGSWRLAELQAGTRFTVTQADCDHEGNRGKGRDRIFVTWKNADGSSETDHLDMRYCDGGGGGTSVTSTADGGSATCSGDDGDEHGGDGEEDDGPHGTGGVGESGCSGPGGGVEGGGSGGSGANGSACSTSAQCASRLCTAGACEQRRPNGQACTMAIQCSSERCQGGTCAAPPGRTGAPCLVADQCESQLCTAGTCEAPRPPGGPCTVADQCESTLCSAGTCQAKGPDGAPCATGRECASNTCVSGVCESPIG